MDKSFSFKYQTDQYAYGKVVRFTESNLTIIGYDSTEVTLNLSEIEMIERDLFPNRKWLEPFGYIAVGAGLALVATPFIWAFDSGEQAVEGLEFAGILAAVSVPPIYIATRKERYNLRKKWRLEVR